MPAYHRVEAPGATESGPLYHQRTGALGTRAMATTQTDAKNVRINDRDIKADGGEKVWRDEEILRELYVGQRMSISEIADTLGCSHRTVRVWLERHNIDTRDAEAARIEKLLSEPAPFEMKHDGYEIWRTKYESETFRVKVHRLLAVAEYGFDAVRDHVVHHKNNIPWDNRPANIEVLTPGEHSKRHWERGDFDGR